MTNHRPTLPFCAISEPDQLTLIGHAHNSQPKSLSSSFILVVILLLALFIALPAAALAQANSQTTDKTDLNLSKPKDVPLKIILPEGYPINGRQAKLIKDSVHNRWFLVFNEALKLYAPEPTSKNIPKSGKKAVPRPKTRKTDKNTAKLDKNVTPTDSEKILESKDPFCHPLEVLPGKWLTAMTKSIGNQADDSLDFRIWGEVTAYQGLLNDYHNRNYILPSFVATLSLFGKDAGEKAKTTKKINPLDAAFGPPNSAEPEISKQTQVLDKSKIPKKLRDALSSIPRTRPLELPGIKQTRTRPKPTVAIPHKTEGKKTSKQNDWRDGYMIIDRVGWIHFDPEGLRWMFTFEADGSSLSEPPVSLHPCRLLEVMENAVDRSSKSLRFRISGQISQYQGRNYMLLRKVLMVYDLGNLVK